MSQLTIQCRLVTSQSTRQQLWQLMAERNTPLINELINQVGQHSEFAEWRQKGKLPSAVVSQACQALKTDPRFNGQPARFYTSAIKVVDYIYKSWLAANKQLQQRLEGKTRWLEILKSDNELVEICGHSLDEIRAKASSLLTKVQKKCSSPKTTRTQSKKTEENKSQKIDRTLLNALFEAYRCKENLLNRCAISYLLKNQGAISADEDPQKFAKRRRKVEIQVQRLIERLEGQMPKGRDLTDQKWLEALEIATTKVPENEAEARGWQSNLLAKSSSLPFPVVFETNEDMVWSLNSKGRLCVRFNGLSQQTFEIYCDQRQLHWFQRFFEDQQTKRNSKDQHSSSLFTLRSGRLAWQEGHEKGDPWNIHRLTLYCTVDASLWSSEGTEQVRQEKSAEIAKAVAHMQEKGDLSETQQAYIKRLNSTLIRINSPFNRPSQSVYQGKPNLVVGVSLGSTKPATVAVWDASTNKVLAYRSLKQLLGDDYKLLNRQRRQDQRTTHQRHAAQKRGASNQFGTSELGQYVDRLLAKAIIEVATAYKASSVALPKLGQVREILQSEIQARAEQKSPGCIEGQQKYAKQYRISIHRWSHGRLLESIQSQAAKVGIACEEALQPLKGSPQDKAREVAITAYQSRK